MAATADSPHAICMDDPEIRLGDRVRVPDGRTGDVVGFYRRATEAALVRFEQGGCYEFVLRALKLVTGNDQNDQTLLHELTERMKDSIDGFNVVMPVSEWADVHLWPGSERVAEE